MSIDMNIRLEQRIESFTESLNDSEKDRFYALQNDWFYRIDIQVSEEDETLYSKFQIVFRSDKDETATYARTVLSEIEAVQRDCRYGEYGREYQFVDSSFEPCDNSIGQGTKLENN